MKQNILIVEANFYPELTEALVHGAVSILEKETELSYERIKVPGVLEIPIAIAYAMETGCYHGYIALGVVIRGETTHYDTVCQESARAIMDLAIKHKIAIGNGIQTVETEEQAWVRCDEKQKNKGGGAAIACLSLRQVAELMKKNHEL